MKQPISIQITLSPQTHRRVRDYAKHIGAVSATGNVKVATAVKKTLRLILTFYSDEEFQKCLAEEGIDTLAYIQRCVRRGMKETLGEKK